MFYCDRNSISIEQRNGGMTMRGRWIVLSVLLALLAAGMMGAFGYAGFKKKEDSE